MFHWCEIPQHRPKDSAQVQQTLFLMRGGVWDKIDNIISTTFMHTLPMSSMSGKRVRHCQQFYNVKWYGIIKKWREYCHC